MSTTFFLQKKKVSNVPWTSFRLAGWGMIPMYKMAISVVWRVWPCGIRRTLEPNTGTANCHAPSIRKTPHLLFCAFSCFFYFFMKKVEKAQKSQVLHLPECFLKQSKKDIAFKSILGQKSTAKKLQVVIKWK